jgi:DNA replication ATP-dependent helicase Dna2
MIANNSLTRPPPRLFACSNATTKPLLYGNILHELLQEALCVQEFDHVALKKMLEKILRRPQIQLDLWAADLGMEEVRFEVWEKASAGLLGFGQRWIGARPSEESGLHNSMSKLSLSGLHDIEESIWSPKWGMKGKVDASVHANIVRGQSSKMSTDKPCLTAGSMDEEQPMPFEIKTGRAVGVMEHRAQTMLYTLLMEERYRTCSSNRVAET